MLSDTRIRELAREACYGVALANGEKVREDAKTKGWCYRCDRIAAAIRKAVEEAQMDAVGRHARRGGEANAMTEPCPICGAELEPSK